MATGNVHVIRALDAYNTKAIRIDYDDVTCTAEEVGLQAGQGEHSRS